MTTKIISVLGLLFSCQRVTTCPPSYWHSVGTKYWGTRSTTELPFLAATHWLEKLFPLRWQPNLADQKKASWITEALLQPTNITHGKLAQVIFISGFLGQRNF